MQKMKVLQKAKYRNESFTRKDLEQELRKDNLRLCKVKDLKIGLKYINIPNSLLFTEIKKENFHVHEVRKMTMSENTEKYLQYKKNIKKFCKNKEIFIFAL